MDDVCIAVLWTDRPNTMSFNLERLVHVKDVQTGYIEITGKCIPVKATTRTAHDNKAVEFLTIEQIQEESR